MKKKARHKAATPNVAYPSRSRWLWLVVLLGLATAAAAGGYYVLAPRDPNAPPGPAPEGMVWVPGGLFWMGSNESMGIDRQSNSQPVHQVHVDGFWMDQTEVTNEQFAKFVEATSYQTVAERPIPEELRKSALPKYRHLRTCSLVFIPPKECPPEDCHNCDRWWTLVEGACWKRPTGAGSDIKGKEKHPVVHICYEDAVAYAEWAGKRLPTEAEWERAARGGLDRKRYYWGDELRPGGRWMANSFQGSFPCTDSAEDGHAGIAPVRSYPPNAYGLYDMAGNVWEWCSDHFLPGFEVEIGGKRRNPTGPTEGTDAHGAPAPMRVLRGGSFLCADSYCARYRAGGRQPGDVATGQSHTGFRCVRPHKK